MPVRVQRWDRCEGRGWLVDVGVDDIDAALARAKDAGGAAIAEAMPIPKIGWAAHVRDSEGNRIGLFQADPDAPVPAA